jgi:pyruvate kinase
MVTLWPSFPHFPAFAADSRLAGIRLNSAMISSSELEQEFSLIETARVAVPLYFDVKGRQLRIDEVLTDQDSKNPPDLEVRLNHPIRVNTPTPVLLKAAADSALLKRVEEDGFRLVFDGGPRYKVRAGESLHIRHPSLRVEGPQFTEKELDKIERVKTAGFTRWFLSYVESSRDVDEFLGLVGRDAEVFLKIENERGLDYVAREFKKRDNLRLVAARGDLYVEIERPHQILDAVKLVIERDKDACVGSRILLSVVHEPILETWNVVLRRPDAPVDIRALAAAAKNPGIPNCADWHELAWLYDIGYRTMMLCDELCLDRRLLGTAVNAFDSFRRDYAG